MRPIVLLLSSLLLTSCAAAPLAVPTEGDDRAVVLAELRERVAEVAERQAEADAAINDVLEVVRAVDEAVVALEHEAAFEDALDRYPSVHDRVTSTDTDGLRDGYLDVARLVDRARATLDDAGQRLDDPWEVAYLDAQDTVLVAVRDYARTADRLAQLLVRHWPTYVEVDTRIADFRTRRGNYRDTDEARDALAVELDTIMEDLVVAEAQIAEYRTARGDAAEVVNQATADAVSVYEQRPDAATSGG